jgi:putative intracellular protease/amidase
LRNQAAARPLAPVRSIYMTGDKAKFLFVLTSHDKLGNTGQKTGFHFSEMADPYYLLKNAGVEVDLASIAGGRPPADPGSLKNNPGENPESVRRFLETPEDKNKLDNTLPVSTVNIDEYDGIYMPGGHGTMWDFPTNEALTRLIEAAWKEDKIVAAVCHGPAAFIAVRDENGDPLVQDRRINSFTDAEEKKVERDNVVPFLLQDKLRALGAIFESAPPFEEIVVIDGRLITGQNPASAPGVGRAILKKLGLRESRNVNSQPQSLHSP